MKLQSVDGFASYKKVPYREVYCDTWRSWLAQVVLIFVVYKIDPLA